MYRFPPRWSIEDIRAAFVVKDSAAQKLGYFHYKEEMGRRSSAKLLTKDEARRIAANFAKLAPLGQPASFIASLALHRLCLCTSSVKRSSALDIR